MTSFPSDFIWGTATSAHQVEGSNWNSDWWMWEHDAESPCVEPSGDACDHYNRYPHDMQLLADLGFGAYRFSIEWARIEPEEGEFSTSQLEHYRRMISCCHEKGLLPVVTFHHFTSPRWIAARGGWEEKATAERFARFCDRAAGYLGDLIPYACTINEPNMPALHGYQTGLFPPGKRDVEARKRANDTFVAAHLLSYEAIKTRSPDTKTGMTLAMMDFQPVDGGEDKLERIRRVTEDVFLEAARGDDFFGVQTYTRALIGPEGMRDPGPDVERSLVGFEYYPEALGATVRRANEMLEGVPLIVTENGVATTDDSRRIEYVKRALTSLHRCVEDGIDVLGYFYWSALDNFEWSFGYGPTFGIIAVDRTTQERTVKPSGTWLGAIARSGALPDE